MFRVHHFNVSVLFQGNDQLERIIQNETNWISGTGPQYISTIQKCVTIVMFALRLKSTVTKSGELTPLEHLIFTQNKQKDSLKVVPRVASYINHAFNKSLPELSCRLMKIFANVSSKKRPLWTDDILKVTESRRIDCFAL